MPGLYDPNTQAEQQRQQLDYILEREGYKRILSPSDSRNLHNLVRHSPSVSPQIGAAVAASGIQWDTPTLRRIIEKDAAQQENAIFRTMKGTSRVLMTALESPWQERMRVIRSGVRVFQGQDPVTAWRSSSPSVGTRAISELLSGNRVNLGTGWLEGQDDPLKSEEFQSTFGRELERGTNFQEAYDMGVSAHEAKAGIPLSQIYNEVAESTLLHKTVDGQRFVSPVSTGRLLAMGVSHPGQPLFAGLSSIVDFADRVSMDPIDIPGNEFSLWRANKRNVIPRAGQQVIRDIEADYLARELGIDDTALREGRAGEVDAHTNVFEADAMQGRISFQESGLTEDEWWARMNDISDETPRAVMVDDHQIQGGFGADSAPRPLGGYAPEEVASNPYAAAHAELDRIATEKYGMNYEEYLHSRYGDMSRQIEDEVIMHELVHSDVQYDESATAILTDMHDGRLPDDIGVSELEKLVEEGRTGGYFGKVHERAIEWRAGLQEEAARISQKIDEVLDRASNIDGEITKLQDEAAKLDQASELRPGDLDRRAAIEGQLESLNGQRNAQHRLARNLNEAKQNAEKLAKPENVSEYDATMRAGMRMLAGESALREARKHALREAGLGRSWRPWLKPQMVEDYLSSSKGQRTIKFLANNKSLSAQRKILKGIPVEVQRRILDADSEAEVAHALGSVLGYSVAEAPGLGARRILGAKMGTVGDSLQSAQAKLGFEGGKITGSLRSGLHRMGSNASKMELNPMDIEQTLDHAEAWLRTVRATDEQVDDVLGEILTAFDTGRVNGEMPNLVRAYDKMADVFEGELRRTASRQSLTANIVNDLVGSDPAKVAAARQRNIDQIVKRAMQDFQKATLENTQYWIDAAGNQIDDVGLKWTELWNSSQNDVTVIPKFSAVLESQTAMTKLTLPNVREVRRATSKLHARTQRMAEATKQAVARSRFLGEEGNVAKVLEALYPEGLEDAWGIRLLDATHNVWRDMALLRIGWPLRVLPEEMVRAAAAGYGGYVQNPVSYLAIMMRQGMTETPFGVTLDDLVKLEDLGAGQFRGDPLRFNVARQSWTTVHRGQRGYNMGLAQQYLQLWADPIASRIARNGLDDTLEWLETTEGLAAARQVTFAGQGSDVLDLSTQAGREAYANRAQAMIAQYTGGNWIRKNANGKWVDSYGQPVPDYREMTKAEIVDFINRGRARRQLDPISAQPSSYTKDHWVEIAVSETGVPPLNTVDSDLPFHIIDEGNADLRRIIGDGTDVGGNQIISPDMKTHSRVDYSMEDLADDLPTYFDDLGIETPQAVRTAREALTLSADKYNGVVDVMFETLMAKPSAWLNRSPFFKQKYSEELAKLYLFADAPARQQLKVWAEQQNITGMFNRQIREQAQRAGFTKTPAAPKNPGKGALSWSDIEELDELARSRSLQATRDLFYDLAERHNVTDMTKHIFPFADAWYEVLSRWAKLLFADPDRSIKNWRRLQVGVTNARKSGWFSEDEYGREVFNWPGAGLLAPHMVGLDDGVGFEATAGIDQLMFIDPNPRGLVMPGVGPIIQMPARFLTPALDDYPPLRDAVNWFSFGDFAQEAPQNVSDVALSFVPSWVRQVASAFLADERRAEFADEIGTVYEAMLMSGQYSQDTPDDMKKTLAAAQSTGTALSWLKVIDRFFAPATPRYRAEVYQESVENGDPFWITSVALAQDYNAAREFFEDSDLATEYIVERFGFNPLMTSSSTFRISEAPATKSAYDFLQENDELYQAMPLTMMAYVDVPESDEFFYPAWMRQQSEGQRVVLTPEQRAWVINEQLGWAEWNNVKETSDQYLQTIRETTEERSDERKRMNAIVNQWRSRRGREIYEEYWAWSNDQSREKPGGFPTKPATGNLWDEMMETGRIGTAANTLGRRLDPAMTDFMEAFREKVNLMRDYSVEASELDDDVTSSSMSWWLDSTTDKAKQLRDSFVDWVKLELMMLPEESQPRGKHILDRWILPTLGPDYEYDDQLWVRPAQIENPEMPEWAIREPAQPVGPGARLMEDDNG